jgi:hypothetical protein
MQRRMVPSLPVSAVAPDTAAGDDLVTDVLRQLEESQG